MDLTTHSHQTPKLSKIAKSVGVPIEPLPLPPQTPDDLATNLDPRLAPPADQTQPLESRDAPSAIDTPHALYERPVADEQLQTLDLHTRNPLVSLKSQLYSCEWASTLGTDLFLTSNENLKTMPPSATPLRTFSESSLLATSRIKLVARPVEAAPRDDPPSLPEESSVTADEVSTEIPVATSPLAGDQEQVSIPVSATASRSRQEQAAFLSKLINIKRARGETDEVTVLVSRKRDLDPGERKKGYYEAIVEPARIRGRGKERGRGRGRGRGRKAVRFGKSQFPTNRSEDVIGSEYGPDLQDEGMQDLEMQDLEMQ